MYRWGAGVMMILAIATGVARADDIATVKLAPGWSAVSDADPNVESARAQFFAPTKPGYHPQAFAMYADAAGAKMFVTSVIVDAESDEVDPFVAFVSGMRELMSEPVQQTVGKSIVLDSSTKADTHLHMAIGVDRKIHYDVVRAFCHGTIDACRPAVDGVGLDQSRLIPRRLAPTMSSAKSNTDRVIEYVGGSVFTLLVIGLCVKLYRR